MFKEKPFYLDDDLNIPYGSSYLFYNYGYDRPIICSFNSGTRQQKWQVSVPIASSIEATMEWLDRVAKDQFIPHFGPVSPLTTTGFEWGRYSGPSGILLESFVPGVSGNKIRGYPIHSSGFWNKFRENLRFARNSTILGIDGTTFNDLNYYTLDRHTVNEISVDGQLPYPKITNEFYHNFIPNMYKAIPAFAGFSISSRWAGLVNKSYSVSSSTDLYDTTIMESSYIGHRSTIPHNNAGSTPNFSYAIPFNRYAMAGNMPPFSDFPVSSGSRTVYTIPNNYVRDEDFGFDNLAININNTSFIGNISRYSVVSETQWQYHSHSIPYPIESGGGTYAVSGTLITPTTSNVYYESSRVGSMAVLLYPISNRGLFTTIQVAGPIWPRDTIISSGDISYPFNVITGIGSGNLRCFVRHYDKMLEPNPLTFNLTKELIYEDGFPITPPLTFTPTANATLDYKAEHYNSNNIKFVYGFITSKPSESTYENIFNSVLNGDYYDLTKTSIPATGALSSIIHGNYNSPDMTVPISSTYFTIDGFTYTSVGASYTDYIYNVDISDALTAIPPVSGQYLFIAMFSDPLLDPSGYIPIGPVMTHKPPDIIYPNSFTGNAGGLLFDKCYSYMYKSDMFQLMSPLLFNNTNMTLNTPEFYNRSISGLPDNNLISFQNDFFLLNPKQNSQLNSAQRPCMFEVEFPHHSYSTKVVPGFLANGAINGEIRDSITGVISSGIIPRYGTMYGF